MEEIQMAQALSKLGYIADKFSPAENPALFRSLMVAALDSQLPVVLLITQKRQSGAGEIEVGHAVTVTGYSEPPEVADVPPRDPSVSPLRMKAASVRVLYVHDDNLGFHAHYELRDEPEAATSEAAQKKRLRLYRGREHKPPVDWWPPDEWEVVGALVPKPSKLRLPLDDLLRCLYEIRTLLESQVFDGISPHYSTKFSSGVAIKRQIATSPAFSPVQSATFNAQVGLPRHVGVLSVMLEADHLCDVLVDVTQVGPSILAVVAPGVPSNSQAGANLKQVAHLRGWDVLCGRTTRPSQLVDSLEDAAELPELASS